MLERILYGPGDVQLRRFPLFLVPAFHVAGAGIYSGVQTLLRAMMQLAAAHAVRRVVAHIRACMERLVNRLKGNFSVRTHGSLQTRVRAKLSSMNSGGRK